MYCRRWGIPVVAACLASIVAVADGTEKKPSSADSPEVAPDKANLHQVLDEAAGQYSLYADADATEPLKHRCILRWANQTRGSVDGATYIWTNRGRPVATACCYPWYGDICENFQSLARAPLRAERLGKIVWQPKAAGVTFQRIADAPAPADSAAVRLRQMKSLARGFNAKLIGWRPDDSDREELRLLSQPVYRYELDGPELLDGALFAFVQGTDPETLLMLEAVPIKAGETDYEWQFALGRRTSGELEVRYGDQIVWTVKKDPEWRDPTLTYFQLNDPLPPQETTVRKSNPGAK